eukprot:4782017-Amphidinium_carterae.1
MALDSFSLARLQAEHRTWKKASGHPHIVTLLDAYLEDGRCAFVMEWMQLSLFHAFESDPRLDERALSVYLQDMLRALKHVHGHGIAVCDVKPEHFLCDEDRNVKLCDFGLAGEIATSDMVMASQCGTIMFMAPEVVNHQGVTEKVDIWALGVAVYTWFYGELPYNPGDYTPFDMETGVGNETPIRGNHHA